MDKNSAKRHSMEIRTHAKECQKKTLSFSLIERVILSAGAMLIFSVSFQIDQMPEGENLFSIIDNIFQE